MGKRMGVHDQLRIKTLKQNAILFILGGHPIRHPPRVRTGDIGNGTYLRRGWHPWAERVVRGLQGFLLQIDEAEIVAHETDDPNTVVDLLDAEALTGEHGWDVDGLAMHADATAGGDEDLAVVLG
jgi:hypothetical protein